MTAKKYLTMVRVLEQRVKNRIEQLDEIRQMRTAIGSPSLTGDAVQTSHTGEAPYAKAVEKIADLEDELRLEILGYIETKNRIIGEIDEIEDPLLCAVLTRRYVQYQRFEQIAFEMHYSFKYILNLHQKALKIFGEMMCKNIERY